MGKWFSVELLIGAVSLSGGIIGLLIIWIAYLITVLFSKRKQ